MEVWRLVVRACRRFDDAEAVAKIWRACGKYGLVKNALACLDWRFVTQISDL